MISKAKYISYETEQEGVLEAVNAKSTHSSYDMPYNAAAISPAGPGQNRSPGHAVYLRTPGLGRAQRRL